MLRLFMTTLAFISLLATSSFAKDVTQCSSPKLKLRDCRLQVGKRKIHVWNNKILIQDEFERGMTDLALTNAEWTTVKASQLGSRLFLEFVAWGAPQGEGEVAAKKWYVYEINGPSAALRAEKLVQRRKRVDENKFKYDKAEKFGLKLEGDKVFWTLGKEKGSI